MRILFVTLLLLLMPVLAYAGNCGCGQPAPKADGCGSDKMPCACMAWEQYCGCEMLTGICISMEADCCDGTAGPLWLLVRDKDMNVVLEIEIPGPIEGYYNIDYMFDEPMDATLLQEAVLINHTDDPVTLTWLQVIGIMECSTFTYFDFECHGVVIGEGGCPRMVLF